MSSSTKVIRIILWIETIIQALLIYLISIDAISYFSGDYNNFLRLNIYVIALLVFQFFNAIFHIAGNRGRVVRFIFLGLLALCVISEILTLLSGNQSFLFQLSLGFAYFIQTILSHFKKTSF